VDADLDTLATALYVRTDDLLKTSPDRAPVRSAVGDQLADHQRRTGHPRGDAGIAGPDQRGPVAALRPRPTTAPVPVPALAAGLQQAAAQAGRHAPLADRRAGPRHRPVDRRRVGGRLHPGRVRPLLGGGAPLGAGRLGRVRPLRRTLPLLLGTAAAPAVHAARPARRLRRLRRHGRRARCCWASSRPTRR
jgi:hypothetical protein